MKRQEMIEWAAPPCHECGEPVVRTEMRWTRENEEWQPSLMFMVCPEGHRVQVEPLP